jgi:hypothetical protein
MAFLRPTDVPAPRETGRRVNPPDLQTDDESTSLDLYIETLVAVSKVFSLSVTLLNTYRLYVRKKTQIFVLSQYGDTRFIQATYDMCRKCCYMPIIIFYLNFLCVKYSLLFLFV